MRNGPALTPRPAPSRAQTPRQPPAPRPLLDRLSERIGGVGRTYHRLEAELCYTMPAFADEILRGDR